MGERKNIRMFIIMWVGAFRNVECKITVAIEVCLCTLKGPLSPWHYWGAVAILDTNSNTRMIFNCALLLYW